PAKTAAMPGKALSSFAVSVTRGTKLIAIGCSTGGPQALFEIMPMIPADCPAGIVIVQHMPKSFTKTFAERLNNLCALDVHEAVEGDEVKPGRVLVAPGGMQFRIVKKTITSSVVKLSPNVENHPHAPSADIMLQSVAALYGERSIGVILTGMGHDGLEGMKAIKAAKGRTVAQDEASSVVYGMPKAVVEAGCADKVVSLSKVIGEIMNMV
ncbi:MAG: chemotaxis protein CheB, partial [Nitrospira defluvii]|nr:chemotaxis protein CheB [Nitrospira defluvii]